MPSHHPTVKPGSLRVRWHRRSEYPTPTSLKTAGRENVKRTNPEPESQGARGHLGRQDGETQSSNLLVVVGVMLEDDDPSCGWG